MKSRFCIPAQTKKKKSLSWLVQSTPLRTVAAAGFAVWCNPAKRQTKSTMATRGARTQVKKKQFSSFLVVASLTVALRSISAASKPAFTAVVPSGKSLKLKIIIILSCHVRVIIVLLICNHTHNNHLYSFFAVFKDFAAAAAASSRNSKLINCISPSSFDWRGDRSQSCNNGPAKTKPNPQGAWILIERE